MTERTIKTVNLLLGLAFLFIEMGTICILFKVTEPKPETSETVPVIKSSPTPTNEPVKPSISRVANIPYLGNGDVTDHAEEVQTALMYATQEIGRYYITAYSHLETGSKATASGRTVHQGTITTCAADPKYHRFGEYLEVNGRIYRVEDTGSAVKGRHLDLYEPSMKKLDGYTGYRTVYKVTFPFGIPKDK